MTFDWSNVAFETWAGETWTIVASPGQKRNDCDFLAPPPKAWERFRALVASPAPRIKGLDLAPDYQNGEVQNVAAIRAAGYLFAFVQVGRGTWNHPNFLEFCKPLVDGGMPVLTYHLLYATQSGIDQADAHLEGARLLWDYQGCRYPAGLDIEVRDGASVAMRQERAYDWRIGIHGELSRTASYCSPSLWAELMGGTALPDIGWVASWTSASEPIMPAGWAKEQTLFWQYGVARKHVWCPPVPGMASDVDVNIFFGTLDDLHNLAEGDPLPPPEPEPIPQPPEDNVNIKERLQILAEELAEIIADIPDGVPTPPAPPQPPTPPPARAITNETRYR